jgi:4-oxalocrotonate tautomerase
MPLVRIELFPGRSKEQKAQIAQAITRALVDIGGAPLEHTWVVFHEEPRENWCVGGKMADS